MHEIEEWIDSAIRNHDLQISKLPREQAQELLDETRAKFLQDNPRAWWMALKVKPTSLSSEGRPLSMVVPVTAADLFFIPEIDEEALPVYRAQLARLERLIEECPFFEYYVVAPGKQWLLVESDHNEYFLCLDTDQSETTSRPTGHE